jgi:hypothetical protein
MIAAEVPGGQDSEVLAMVGKDVENGGGEERKKKKKK